MESALVFAEAGLPVGFMSMAIGGSTAPATIPGIIAVADAEMVAAMVLVQMAYPGAPTYHSMMPGIMQDISIFSPLNWGLEGFYTIFLRNGACADIMPWVIPLVVFSIVCMMVAFYFLRLKKN